MSQEYRGCVSKALELLYADECDVIVLNGRHFQCLKCTDEAMRTHVRDIMKESLKGSIVRYIVVYDDGNIRKCLSNDYKLCDEFSHAYFYNAKVYAEAILSTVVARFSEYKKECFHVEEYLYHTEARCTLRIYYDVKGLAQDFGLLQYIREQVLEGVLPIRIDRKGKHYIMLEDLLPYKDTRLTLRNSFGTEYVRYLDLKILLHDGLIGFSEIRNFCKRHPELEIPKMMDSLDAEKSLPFYDVGWVVYTNSAVQEVASRELALANAWFLPSLSKNCQ